eukprot:1151824-Pelagomonas_calceolata.AAC.2
MKTVLVMRAHLQLKLQQLNVFLRDCFAIDMLAFREVDWSVTHVVPDTGMAMHRPASNQKLEDYPGFKSRLGRMFSLIALPVKRFQAFLPNLGQGQEDDYACRFGGPSGEAFSFPVRGPSLTARGLRPA